MCIFMVCARDFRLKLVEIVETFRFGCIFCETLELGIWRKKNFQGLRCRMGSDRYGIVSNGCGMCLRVNVRRKYVHLCCVRVIVG